VPGGRQTVLSGISVMEQSTHGSCSYITQVGQSSVQIFNCCSGDASNLKRMGAESKTSGPDVVIVRNVLCLVWWYFCGFQLSLLPSPPLVTLHGY